jgi:hypothetical protein
MIFRRPRFDDVLSGRAPLGKAAPQDLLAASAYALARERFYKFRQLIHPGMIWNWWTREVSDHLEQFYYDMQDGLRPRLALMSPPQHGKSFLATDFIAWLGGLQPDWQTIYASYSTSWASVPTRRCSVPCSRRHSAIALPRALAFRASAAIRR